MSGADSAPRSALTATERDETPMSSTAPPPKTQPSGALRRWLPALVLLALMGLAVAMGWHRHLSFKTVGLNYEALRAFIAANTTLSLLAFTASYAAIVALSLPGALIMTLTGGLLFGWKLGAPATVVGATLGATLIYVIARSSLGEAMTTRAGPFVARLRDGFRENALSYMLFLRLVPAFPFVIVNLAAAVLAVPLRTYVIGTFLGIIPGTTAYSLAGSALGSAIEAQNANYRACLARAPAGGEAACPYTIDTTALVGKEILIAFALLGIVALIPVAIEKWKARHAAV